MTRNLKFYLAANAISLTGAWMHFVAIYWLAYQITQSATTLGMLSLISGIPMLIFSLIGGTLSDRFPRKKLLCILQLLSAITALTLSLTTYNKFAIEILFIFSALFGVLFSLESPLKQAILPSLLSDKGQLSSAISWNVIINHLARIAGPFFCGFFLLMDKIYLVFAMYGISILISAFIFYIINIENKIENFNKGKTFDMIKEGFKYTLAKKDIFYLILTTSILGFSIGPYTSQMPNLITTTYPNYVNSLTIFYAATGSGGLFAALILRYILAKEKIPTAYFIGFIISIIALSSFFYGTNLYFGLIMMFITTCGMMITSGSTMIYIQNHVSEKYRGRVLGFYNLLFMGLAPLSNALCGFMCDLFGSKNTFLIASAISFISISFFFIYNLKLENLIAKQEI